MFRSLKLLLLGLSVLGMQLNSAGAQEEYATVDLSVAQRNYFIPSQFAFQVDEDERVVISSDIRYTHNGFGAPYMSNQDAFGLMISGGSADEVDNGFRGAWWQGSRSVFANASRGQNLALSGAFGNRAPGPSAIGPDAEVPWVENWIPHNSVGIDPYANVAEILADVDPDDENRYDIELVPVEDRVDQVSDWLRYEWVLDGFGDAIEAFGLVCRTTDADGELLLDGTSCLEVWEDDEFDEAFLFRTTTYELNTNGDGPGFDSDAELYAGFATGWTETTNRSQDVQDGYDTLCEDPLLCETINGLGNAGQRENPAANGDGLISKEEATNYKQADVDNFSISKFLRDPDDLEVVLYDEGDVLFSDDFSEYEEGAPIGGGLPADGEEPVHNWNPKYSVVDPDGIADSGDEDLSQQQLFVRDGVFVEEPSCIVPDGNIVGDFNNDGNVNFNDFLTLSTNFGQEVGTYEEGDTNCDGNVDFNDFLALSTNFGQSAGSAAAAAVPEPSAFALLLCSLTLLVFRRRRS